MDSVKYAGVPVHLGDSPFICPPLSLGQVRSLEQNIKTLQEAGRSGTVDWSALLDNNLPIIEAALSRNYGARITREFLLEHADIGTMPELIKAALAQGGARSRSVGEPQPATNQ